MTTERFEVQREIAASPATVFALLCDPNGHVAIDSSGMAIKHLYGYQLKPIETGTLEQSYYG